MTISDESVWINSGRMDIGCSGNGAEGILNIFGGAVVQTYEAKIACCPGGSSGSVFVSAAGGANSEWNIETNLEIGDDPNAVAYLTVGQGGSMNCNDLRLASCGSSLGILTINGGQVSTVEAILGEDEQAVGTAIITGKGSAWSNTGDVFVIGVSGSGEITVAKGGTLFSISSILGFYAGSNGTMIIDGPNSIWINLSDIYIGEFGSGMLSITNGGSVSNTAGFVGSFNGSIGTAHIDGPDSSWTNLVSVAVGNFGEGVLTVSNDGTVAAPQITISNTGEINGVGILDGNVTNSGRLSPGLSIGTLNIQGDYLQTPIGVLEIKLGASGSGGLAITGQAELSYPTLMLSVVCDDKPSVGQMFTILTAAHIFGQDFTVIDDGGIYELSKSSNDIVVTVVALPCPWDLDCSGAVGTSDLLALFAQWGTAGPADFDGSGAVDTSDLLILFANWGPCP